MDVDDKDGAGEASTGVAQDEDELGRGVASGSSALEEYDLSDGSDDGASAHSFCASRVMRIVVRLPVCHELCTLFV